MSKMTAIHERYRDLCCKLGDYEVKIKGLQNARVELFKQLEALDDEAAQAFKDDEAARDAAARDKA